MRTRHSVPRFFAAALLGLTAAVAVPLLRAQPASAAGTNLALGKSMTSSGYNQTYSPTNANDANQAMSSDPSFGPLLYEFANT